VEVASTALIATGVSVALTGAGGAVLSGGAVGEAGAAQAARAAALRPVADIIKNSRRVNFLWLISIPPKSLSTTY